MKLFTLILVAVLVALTTLSQDILSNESRLIAKSFLKNKELNTLKFITFNDGALSEKNAQNWLNKELAQNDEDEWRWERKESDQLGFTHDRYKRYNQGYKVENNTFLIHRNGQWVVSANGHFQKAFFPKIQQNVSVQQAITRARQKVSDTVSFWGENQYLETVWIIENGLASLCYKLDIHALTISKRAFVYIDVTTGKIVRERDRIHTNDEITPAKTNYYGDVSVTAHFDTLNQRHLLRESGRRIHTMNANRQFWFPNPSEYTTNTGEWDNPTDLADGAYDAHYSTELVYDFFVDEYNRFSFDNAGLPINVRANSIFLFGGENAAWNGNELLIGYGGSTAGPMGYLEVLGHEYTHGIVQHTCGLDYYRESGALNESFCDIFAIAMDHHYFPNSFNYLIGDKHAGESRAFRDVSNPKSKYDPNTYMGDYWESRDFDNGGVHTNSSVQNFWFYLLANGGTGENDNGDSYDIQGLGLEKAADVAYRNMTVYLTELSNYEDARIFSIQAAQDLYGACSEEVIAVTNAWHAVGVGEPYNGQTKADFEAELTSVCSPNIPIAFTNLSVNATDYLWEFDNGNTSTAANPVHTFGQPGIYSIRLTASSNNTCGSTDQVTMVNHIHIQDSPITPQGCIPAGGSPSQIHMLYKVEFNDISNQTSITNYGYEDFVCTHTTTVEAGKKYELSLDFRNGRAVRVWLDINNDGYFEADEILNDHAFQEDEEKKLMILIPEVSDYNTLLRMRIGIDEGFSSLDFPCGYLYDGQYEDYGVYVLPNTGGAPIADFRLAQNDLLANDTFQLIDYSENLPNDWYWEFPGSNEGFSTDKNPQVTYPVPGAYEVTLRVSNGFGSDTVNKTHWLYVFDEIDMCTGITEVTSPAGYIYDSGGKLGEYGNNENCTLSIQPECGDFLSLEVQYDDIGAGDDLYIDPVENYAGSAIHITENSASSTTYLNHVYTNYQVRFTSNGSLVGGGYKIKYKVLNGGIYAKQLEPVLNTENNTVEYLELSEGNYLMGEQYLFQAEPISSQYSHFDSTQLIVNDEITYPGFYHYVTFTDLGEHKLTFRGYNCGKATDSTFYIDVTGVAQYEPNVWKIYPNPSNNEFKVYFEGTETVIKSEIIDTYGRVIQNLNVLEPKVINKIELGEHAVGVYFLKVTFASGAKRIERLVKNQ